MWLYLPEETIFIPVAHGPVFLLFFPPRLFTIATLFFCVKHLKIIIRKVVIYPAWETVKRRGSRELPHRKTGLPAQVHICLDSLANDLFQGNSVLRKIGIFLSNLLKIKSLGPSLIVKILKTQGAKRAGNEGKERKEKKPHLPNGYPLSLARLTLAKDKCYLPKKIRAKSDLSIPSGKITMVSFQNKCICRKHWQGSLKDCFWFSEGSLAKWSLRKIYKATFIDALSVTLQLLLWLLITTPRKRTPSKLRWR